MQEPESKAYFHKRAEEERAAAERARDERAARSHRELARRFDDLAKRGGDERLWSEPGERPAVLPAEFRILP